MLAHLGSCTSPTASWSWRLPSAYPFLLRKKVPSLAKNSGVSSFTSDICELHIRHVSWIEKKSRSGRSNVPPCIF